MRKFAMMAAVAAATLLGLPAAAHAEWYAGAGYTHYDYYGGDLGGVTGRLGYRVNPNFAVEGELSTGVEDDHNVELNYDAGIYAVGILPVTQSLDLHARLGYHSSELDTPGGDFTEDGVAYGAGGTWRINQRWGVRADYTRLDGDDADADAVSLGAVVNF